MKMSKRSLALHSSAAVALGCFGLVSGCTVTVDNGDSSGASDASLGGDEIDAGPSSDEKAPSSGDTDSDIVAEVIDDPKPVNVDCDSEVDWDVTEDTVLYRECSPYDVDDVLEVSEAATLTIQPGVELRFQSRTWLSVGDTTAGKIVAEGTEQEPIVFTSDTPDNGAAGQWRGIVLMEKTSPGTRFQNVSIRYAGAPGFGVKGCLSIQDVAADSVSLDGVELDSCEQSGLWLDAAKVSLSSLSFKNMDTGLWIAADSMGSVSEAASFDAVVSNRVQGGTVTADATWLAQPVAYDVSDSVEVEGVQSPVLTLREGLVLRFEQGDWLEVGGADQGGLQVHGSQDNPVVLQSTIDAAAEGSWRGIFLKSQALNDSTLDYLHILHAGQSGFGVSGCVTLDKPGADQFNITNSIFEKCAQSGVSAEESSHTLAKFEANTFKDMDTGLRFSPSAVGSVVGGQVYEDVVNNIITEDTLSEDAVWPKQDIPWDVEGRVSVEGASDPVLTIAAGTTVRFGLGDWLEVGDTEGGGLLAVGTAAEPVVLTTSIAAAAPGSWRGVFLKRLTLPGTRLDYVELSYAGQNGFSVRGGVTLADTAANVILENSTFSDNAQADVYVDDGSVPTLTSNTYSSPIGLVEESR